MAPGGAGSAAGTAVARNLGGSPSRSARISAAGRPPLWRLFGPRLITGADDDDPSGIASYTQAGAQFAFRLGWTLFLSYPLLVADQAICAQIGRTTGLGIAGNLRKHYPASRPWSLVWPAVLNGIIAAPVMITVTLLGARVDVMGTPSCFRTLAE